ncbi:MAG: septal ring lytic transglycosylase RlpA family protein [Desulfobacterales bacterium]|nr:septal ring lytic transglycosylase RlpA family protein [Desulfobacterales bacterium]
MNVKFRTSLFLSISVILVALCSCAAPKYRYYPKPSEREVEVGVASWYGSDFHGKPTSSGERYNMYDLTAAHKLLPLGTYAMVTNLDNRRSVEVKINDRGPFVGGRIIDLSFGAAKALDMVDCGIAMVRVEVTKRVKFYDIPYTLQVASFKEESNALVLKKELDKKYKDVYIVATTISNMEYYRVRLGYFKSEESAKKEAQRLIEDNYTVFITRRD